ncbi:MAG: hypothetical protein E6224_05060, partial [Haemophilus parainfluenzae]|nr:hypothetical protein [Haemophilus parainfluenzae]
KYSLTFPILDFHKKREGERHSLFFIFNSYLFLTPNKYKPKRFTNISQKVRVQSGIKAHFSIE